MAITDIPLNNVDGIAELISLMKQQVTVLHRIDRRQATADVSTQPFAQVAETSSSVWGALLRSRIAEDIQPQVDRWRSGLDALLVFLGLFSAVVTSFLVDSLTGLRQDEAVRTNELLANLTEILVQLGTGANSSTLKVSAPVSFQPDAVDVRLNSYWSISLILSLSIAALAVACRGFVNMTMMSSRTRAVDKVIDINTRWKGAEKVLGPTLEIIPQLLITPVILFVVGLLDRLFSSILGLGALPAPIAAASGVALFCIAGVVAFLVFTLVDASSRPDSSPFQSTLARFVRKAFKIGNNTGFYTRETLTSTYHEIVQATHDDETLDKAAAALRGIMGTSESENNDLPKTLVHLLSPEASIRCNHTATHVIVDLEKDLNVSDDSQSLLSGLAEAAYRDRLIVTLWTSPYIKACAFLVGAFHKDHPPVMCIIGSDYACSLKRTQFMDNLLLDILFDHLDHVSPDGHPTPPLVQLFEPDFIVPRNVLRFLEDTHVRLKKPKVSVIISLLMTAKPPAVVLSAIREQAVGGDFLVAERVGFLVVEAVLQLPEQAADWEDVHLLEELCYTCMSIARRAQYHSWHIPGTVNATLVRLPPTSAASAALTRLMAELKESCPRLVFPGVSRPKKQIRLR